MQQCSLVAFWNAGHIYTIFRRWRYKGNQGNILIDRYWQWRNYWSRWTLGSLLQIQLLIKASRKLDKRYNLKSWLGSKWQNWIFWISRSLSFWKITIKNEPGSRKYEVVDHMRAWTIWGSGPFEGVDHLRSWTIWGSGPFEGVDHMKEWTIWRSGPFEGVDRMRE